jgi:hypothetical protein
MIPPRIFGTPIVAPGGDSELCRRSSGRNIHNLEHFGLLFGVTPFLREGRMMTKVLRRIASVAAVSALVGSSFMLTASASAATAAASYWSFNEVAAASPAIDSIGGNNGVASGSPEPAPSTDVPFSSGGNTGSMQFDGQNYFKVNNTVGDSFSICAWIKTSSTGGTNHWENAPIVDSEMGGFDYDFGFGVTSNGNLAFGNGGDFAGGGSGDATVPGIKVVNDNLWHHVCVSRNNTNGEIVLYVDGAQDAVGVTGTGLVTRNSEAWIGHGQDGNAPFVGLIDEVRFYTAVITPADVQELFAPPPPVEEEEEQEESPSEPEVTFIAENNLADTGGVLSLALPIGAFLLLSGLATWGVARSRAKQL